jgi:hypothetical protein
MRFDKLCNSILERVFHGTPHDVVGNFSLNKIGSGEGAQVYGWGLYFAENPKVADSYKKNLTHKDFINKVSQAYDEYMSPDEADDALEDAGLTANQMALVKALQKEDWWGFDYPHQAVRAALREPDNFEHGEEVDKALKTFGNLYEVEINADKENDFLDWDKPASQQSDKVRKAWELAFSDRIGMSFSLEQLEKNLGKEPLGSDLYWTVETNDPKAASLRLKEFGIKGIRYLDQDSRITGEGTYNYVIFDPSVIRIVSKNGEFVMQSKTPENVEV